MTWAGQRDTERGPRADTVGIEVSEQIRPTRSALGGRQGLELGSQTGVEHVEVADTTEHGPEPFELPAQAVDPSRIEERATCAEDGPESTDRHAHLVDVLGIASGAGAGLVGVNGVDLPFHRRENVIEGVRGQVDHRPNTHIPHPALFETFFGLTGAPTGP